MRVFGGQLAVTVSEVERRAAAWGGEVAGAAEDDEVGGRYGAGQLKKHRTAGSVVRGAGRVITVERHMRVRKA